jgi:hypothetical protein
MYADPPGLDDPQRACGRPKFGQGEEIAQTLQQRLWRHPSPWLQNHQASALLRRESEHLPKVVIQGNKNSIFISADFKDCFVTRAQEVLVSHRHHVVAGRYCKIGTSPSNVLVQLDPHSRGLAKRKRQNSLARHLGAVGDRGHYVLVSELGILSPQFMFAHPAGQEIQDK